MLFSENREGFRLAMNAGEALHSISSPVDLSLSYVIQEGMTITDIDRLVRLHPHSFYPVVASRDFPCIVGQVQRRDLLLVLKARKNHVVKPMEKQSRIENASVVSISKLMNKSDETCDDKHRRASVALQESKVLKLHKLVDRAPIVVTEQTPMEAVIDMFRKLGCRQIFVTRNG